MITITVPINTLDNKLKDLRDRLDHLVKYHPQYSGHEFSIHKAHISLINIEGEVESMITAVGKIDPSLLSHIEATIKDCL